MRSAAGSPTISGVRLGLFTFAIFLSALLLFLVQPMAGKLVLPLLGGSPAVWNTSLLFFQTTLLAGYLYAHLLRRVRDARVELGIHVVVMAAALSVLPIALRTGGDADAVQAPVTWLLRQLLTSIGLPFFVLSSTGPLLQRWFASTDDPAARDPYFLYAASNTGSLLALLGYPILELLVGLKAQAVLWTIGYAAFVVTCAACGVWWWRRGDTTAGHAHGASPISWQTRARWMLLAFVPSTLMLGVTLFLTSDLASAPLLWVLPLSIYLVTFILAFARRRLLPLTAIGATFTTLVVVLAAASLFHWTRPVALIVALHLLALFFGAWLCHGQLAAERPHVERLTEFYLLLSAGGALGGVFAALLAPRLFDAVLEYPIAIGLALLLQVPRGDTRKGRGLDLAVPLLGLVAFVALVAVVHAAATRLMAAQRPGLISALEIAVTAVPLVIFAASFRRPLRAALAFAAVVFIVQTRVASTERLIHVERTFFGVHRVTSDAGRQWRRLSHGTTRHGIQFDDPSLSFRPMAYYHPTGPIGDVFRTYVDDPSVTRVGIIGLGAGTLAAYATPGRYFTFFEIDPEVERIADRFFTYIQDARGRGAAVDVVLGDARLTVGRQPDATFDLLVGDAFSSDAIPLHLLTREAIELYVRKLKPHGLLAFHVSNGSLDLRPVLGAVARELGLRSYACRDAAPPQGWPPSWIGKDSSTWILLARNDEDLRTLPRAPADDRWISYSPSLSAKAWTDDHSNLLTAIPRER